MTDHGSFVLFNVYVPNAGDRPERARLPAKLSFLSALKERVDELRGAGRQVRGGGMVGQHCADQLNSKHTAGCMVATPPGTQRLLMHHCCLTHNT